MSKPIDESFGKLVDICDRRHGEDSLTLEDCQNLYLLITGLRCDLSAAQETLADYGTFYKKVKKALRKLEESGE